MTRCASPLLFAGIASFLSARTGGRFRLIIGYETPENQDVARDGAAIIEASGGHALLMPRALPAPLTAFSVRMVMADGAVYVRASGEALIYLGGRAIDRSREGALAPDAELALIDEAVAAYGDEASLSRSQGGWESVGDGMIGAYVDRCASRIASLEPSGARVVGRRGGRCALPERFDGWPHPERVSVRGAGPRRVDERAEHLSRRPHRPWPVLRGPGLRAGRGRPVRRSCAGSAGSLRPHELCPGDASPGHCRLRSQLTRRRAWR